MKQFNKTKVAPMSNNCHNLKKYLKKPTSRRNGQEITNLLRLLQGMALNAYFRCVLE